MPRRPTHRPSPPSPLPASLERLHAAGIVASVEYDAATGEGAVRFTPAYHALLLAGRLPFVEPGFLEAWQAGDPRVVRAWVEREAALLDRGRGAPDEEVSCSEGAPSGGGWLARKDSNLQPPDPESGALPLSHSPARPVAGIRSLPCRRRLLNRPSPSVVGAAVRPSSQAVERPTRDSRPDRSWVSCDHCLSNREQWPVAPSMIETHDRPGRHPPASLNHRPTLMTRCSD